MDKSPIDKLWAETLKKYGYNDSPMNKSFAEKVVDGQGVDSLTEYVENRIVEFSKAGGSASDKDEKDRSGSVSGLFRGDKKAEEALRMVTEGLKVTREALKTFLQAFVDNSDTLGDLADLGFPGTGLIVVLVARIVGAAFCVKGAYDKIQDLYSIMKSFVRRLNLLNDGLATVKEHRGIEKYLEMIREVLGNMLQFCDSVERKVRNKRSHIMDFFKAIFLGEDQELKKAYDSVIISFDSLTQATVMQTLSTSLQTQSATIEMSKTMVDMFAMFKRFFDDHESMQDESKKQSLRNDDSRRQPEKTERAQGESRPNAETTATSPLANAFKSVARSLSSGAEPHVIRRLLSLTDLRVRGTTKWLYTTSEYTEFLKWSSGGVLSIEGGQGSGKSVLTAAVFEDLYTRFQRQPKSSVAYFTFDSHIEELQLVPNMLTCCAAQVALVDREYQQAIKDTTREYGKTKDEGWKDAYWEGLFERPFKPGESRRLIMVLDGINYLKGSSLAKLETYVDLVASNQLQISFVLAGLDQKTGEESSGDTPDTPEAGREEGGQEKKPKYWNVRLGEHKKDQIRQDMRLIVTERIESFKNLKTLRLGRKKRIVDAISNNADTFSYIDHALRKLDKTKSWFLIYSDLQVLPKKTEELYKDLLRQCKSSYHSEEQKAIVQFLTWLAYCQKENELLGLEAAQLLFDHIWRIVRPESPHMSLKLQEQISGRLSRIVTVSEDDFDDSSPDEEGSTEDGLSDTGSEVIGKDAGSSEDKTRKDDEQLQKPAISVCFQELSLREFFRQSPDIAGDDSSADEMRPTRAEAHIMMVKVATAILLDEKTVDSPDAGALEELQFAAAKCWMQQFCNAIRLNEAAENDQIREQLRGMFQKIAESTAAILCFEKLVDIFSKEVLYYSILGETQELETECLATLRLIADNEQVDRWLLSIARCHVQNFLHAPRNSLAYRSLRFAHLSLCHAVPERFPDGISEQLQYELSSDSFESVAKWCLEDIDEPDYQKVPKYCSQLTRALDMANHHQSALVNAELGLELDDIDTTLRIEFLCRFARCQHILWEGEEDNLKWLSYSILNKFREASVKIQESLEGLDASDSLKEMISQTYKSKARLEAAYPDSRKDVLESVRSAVAADSSSFFPDLDEVIEGFAESQMWESIVELLFILKNPLLNANDDKTFRSIHRAAKMCGKEAEILELYRQAVAHLRLNSMSASSLRIEQAQFERFLLQDGQAIERAKRLLMKTLHTSQTDNRIAVRSMRILSDILIEEFRVAKTLTEKEAAREELESISKDLEQRQGFDHSRHLSPESSTLVIMRQQLGPARKFFEEAREVLAACKQGLSDNWNGNDTRSFCQAARILALLPACKDEAVVAMSLQCYNTAHPEDPSVYLRCSMCRRNLEHGDEIYECIYCASTHICSSCYEERRRHNEEENTTEKSSYVEVCPWGHRHVKVESLEMENMENCTAKFESWLETFDSKWAKEWEKKFYEDGGKM